MNKPKIWHSASQWQLELFEVEDSQLSESSRQACSLALMIAVLNRTPLTNRYRFKSSQRCYESSFFVSLIMHH